ncbi:MAG: cysteine synthase family protein [Bryobacterales bacterium]|nr:cysteine synthase family protein [Bryobacterales bacterium]
MIRRLPDSNFYLHSLAPTPLAPVALFPGDVPIWCKLEFLNPSGSTKDRIARFILGKAWREGRLQPGDTVVEASSGSTSIAMALTSAQLGVKFIAAMPEGVSNERVLMIRAYGGAVRFTAKADGIHGAIREAERLAAEEGCFLPRQFHNMENAAAHASTTAREIAEQIPGGAVDAVVSGVGTGGTLVGIYQGLRQTGSPVRPVLARPIQLDGTSEVECCSFSSRIPGVVDSVSTIFKPEEMPDLETIEVRDGDAIDTTRQLIGKGFPVGPSSGLNYFAARQIAKKLGPSARIVTVFPDRMERYFTTELFTPYH